MPLIIADRVKETTATTGTGTLTLAGAATQFQSFGAVGNGNQCNYCLLGGNGTDWETGIGTYTLSGTTLSRTKVLASSNSGSLISLTGTSTVFLTEPAAALFGPPIVPPSAASNWTQKNFGGSTTLTDVSNGVALFDASTAGVAIVVRGITLASPSSPYTIDANLLITPLILASTTGTVNIGIGWSDGTKIQMIELNAQVTSGTTFAVSSAIIVNNFTNFTTYSGSATSVFSSFNNIANTFLRIADNGTNVTLSSSSDGVTYVQLYTVAKSSGFLGSSGYTNVGLFFRSGSLGNGSSGNVTLRSWYQH